MATQRSLARPPIREAIIEIRSEPREFSLITDFKDQIAERFPRCKPFRLSSVAFALPDDSDEGAAGSRQIGWRCESDDRSEVLLLRTDGFAIARLSDYPGWDGFLSRFCALWDPYQVCVQPVEVNRVNLRYVNDLRLPIRGAVDFSGYLTTLPRVPLGLPAACTDFVMQMTMPSGTDGMSVNVTQASDANGRTESEMPVVIDIDVFSDRLHSGEPRLSERLAGTLSEMREIKNRVFFGLITDRLADCYQ
jgi:uncharacterized protein (TIGR04255 family)